MPTTPIKGKLADRARETGVVIPIVAAHLRNRTPEFRRQDIIHPSEMAKADWCPVATYNHILHGKPREELKFTQENIFAEGNAIHHKWQTWLKESGKLWGIWKCQICHKQLQCSSGALEPADEYDYCPVCRPDLIRHRWDYREIPLRSTSHIIAGFADGGILDENCLIELKSVGLGTLRMEEPALLNRHRVKTADDKWITDIDGLWKNIRRPTPSHMRQGQIYLWLAREMGLPFTKIQFVYEFKPNQQVKEFSVSLNEEILAPLLDKALRIKHAIERGKPPVCELEECKSCPDEGAPRRRIVHRTASMTSSPQPSRS